MRRKAIAVFLVTAAALLALIVTTSAADNSSFGILLNKEDKTVTVTGFGFEPGERVSLMAAYNEEPSFANLDYLDQITADAEGGVIASFPSKAGEWLGGHEYVVALNGQVESARILATYANINTAARSTIRVKSSLQLDFDIDGVAYEFVSSNPTILRVDSSGLITPNRAGMATVSLRATDGSGLTASVLVNVTP
jgi:hypothetical protein